jgi:hypothetical protein
MFWCGKLPCVRCVHACLHGHPSPSQAEQVDIWHFWENQPHIPVWVRAAQLGWQRHRVRQPVKYGLFGYSFGPDLVLSLKRWHRQYSCHALLMPLPCHCNAIGMLSPCSCLVLCDAIAMLLLCHCHALATLLPCSCHALAMALSSTSLSVFGSKKYCFRFRVAR